MIKFLKILTNLADFTVGFVFNLLASGIFSLFCFPINIAYRVITIRAIYQQYVKKATFDQVFKLTIIEASYGALFYLIGSIIGLIIYIFVLLPNVEFFQKTALAVIFNSTSAQFSALRYGTLCSSINIIFYFIATVLVSLIYYKLRKGNV
ncbi:MAG: hypothetical protein WCJ58_04585 [bacterium]